MNVDRQNLGKIRKAVIVTICFPVRATSCLNICCTQLQFSSSMETTPAFFVFYRFGGMIAVTQTDRLPKECFYDGRLYVQTELGMGDFNHLLNAKEELIGFEFPYFDIRASAISESRLVTESANARLENESLSIVFSECADIRSDGWNAIGDWVYSDGSNDHIIIIPDMRNETNICKGLAFEIGTNATHLEFRGTID